MKLLLLPVESMQDFRQIGHKESFFFFNKWEILCVQDIPVYCVSKECSSHLHQEKLTESQTQPHVTDIRQMKTIYEVSVSWQSQGTDLTRATSST